MQLKRFAPEGDSFRWSELEVKKYSASGTTSSGIDKQVLFEANQHLDAELRYFETAPGGYSALERHDHVHVVLILRGRGTVLVGEEVTEIAEHDVLYIPPQKWHQFHAASDSYLGFLCLVRGERDRPSRPTEAELAELSASATVKSVIRF